MLLVFVSMPALQATGEDLDSIKTAPLNPEFEAYMKALEDSTLKQVTEEGYPLGYIPPPMDLPLPRVTLDSEHIIQMIDLPASFDLRDLNRVTTVKNQIPAGSCWAFATYGSLESYLKQWETYDFSENHLKNTHGFDSDHDEGGNLWMATAYLARWSGPVSEQDDPYDPHSSVSPPDLDPIMHVQKVEMIPWLDQDYNFYGDEIKQRIKDNGALYTAFYWDSDYYCEDNYAFYFDEFVENVTWANHAVAIVGWDDNYDKENFDDEPPGDGAFILKNSWGDKWGDEGYFYMSYHDYYAGFVATAFHNAESINNYIRVYQYDELGISGSHGLIGRGDTCHGANIFTAEANEALAAVSTYAQVPFTEYEIMIYTGVNAGEPSSGTLRLSQSGTLSRVGYHTIELENNVSLTSGEQFSVVIKYTTPGWERPVPGEGSIEGYSSNASIEPGQSFIGDGDMLWIDIYDVGDDAASVCIKAFTSSLSPHVLDLKLSAIPSDWQYAGEPIIFTAEVTEGNQDAEFRFYYRVDGGSWRSATSYSTDNTWTVSTSYVGELQVGVLARAVGSDATVEAWAIIDYEIVKAPPVEAVELTADPSGSQLAGEDFTFTANVTEGNENAEFRFYYKIDGGRWRSATSYSTDNTWTRSTGYVGDVQIGVIARAVGSDASEEARDYIDYEITALE